MLGRLDDAYHTALKAVEVVDERTDPRRMASALTELAYACKDLGRLEEGDRHVDRALALWRDRSDKPIFDLASTWNVRGELARVGGEYERALDHYERAHLLADRASDALLRGAIQINLGITLAELGRWQAAAQTSLQAAHLLSELDDPGGASMARVVLGLCAAKLGDWDLWEREVRPGLVWLDEHDVIEVENADFAQRAADAARAAGRHEEADLAQRIATTQRAGLDAD